MIDLLLTNRPVASVTINQTVDHEEKRFRKDAYLLGSVTRVSGIAKACEVETEDGRFTLVPIDDVEALNDAAKAILTASGPPVEVHADDVEDEARALLEEDEFDDNGE